MRYGGDSTLTRTMCISLGYRERYAINLAALKAVQVSASHQPPTFNGRALVFGLRNRPAPPDNVFLPQSDRLYTLSVLPCYRMDAALVLLVVLLPY